MSNKKEPFFTMQDFLKEIPFVFKIGSIEEILIFKVDDCTLDKGILLRHRDRSYIGNVIHVQKEGCKWYSWVLDQRVEGVIPFINCNFLDYHHTLTLRTND